MKIIYVDQTGKLGGGELSLLDWIRAAGVGDDVILFTDGPFRDLLEEAGARVTVLPIDALSGVRRGASLHSVLSALPNFFRLRVKLRHALRAADVVYANSQKAFLLSAFSMERGRPLLWHLRDLLTPDHFSALLRKLAVFAGNRYATFVMVNSEATGEAFVEQGGDRSKIRVVPDGIDERPFDSVDLSVVPRFRKAIGVEDRFVVGLFGRLAAWKGQHILLEAIALIPDVHACLIGAALFGEEAYEQQLRERAARADVAGRVHFLGFRRDIPELMMAMDVVVHASVSPEPLGRVIVEGMFARKPVIATRAGGAAEIVENERSGLLVTPGSVDELCDAIRRLQTDTGLRARLAEGGRSRAQSTYSLQSMVDRTRRVLEEVGRG